MQTKNLFCAFLVLISVNVFAQNSVRRNGADHSVLPVSSLQLSITRITDSQKPSVAVVVENPNERSVRLVVEHNASGNTMDTSFRSSLYSRRFNFEEAEDGRYTVTVISGRERISKTVLLNTTVTRNVEVRD